MSFGWSAGDVVSAMKLLYTVGKALKESCGASSDFAETSSFLLALQTTLRLLQSLDTVAINPEFAESFKELCRQIQLPLDAFLKDVLKYEPALSSAGKKSKILTVPRKMQWALVMPSKVKKLQSQIGGAMLAVNTLMGHQALDLVSRLQTAMPSLLNDHLTAALERNLAANLIDSVVQPLEHALLACKEELVTMNKKSRMDTAQGNRLLNGTASDSLQSSNEQYLESLSDLLQALQATNLRIDQSNDSNHVMDGSTRSAVLSGHRVEIDRLRTTWQSVPALAAPSDAAGEPINQEDDLAMAFQRMGSQLKICVWLFISKVQGSIQELILALLPFFAIFCRQLSETTRRIPSLMIGDRFSFEDALGRTQLLPCTDFQSWKIFCAYLETSFEGLPGFDNVVRKRFEIMNGYNEAVINETMWTAVMQPKTKLAMAMVIARSTAKDGDCLKLDDTGKAILTQERPSVVCPVCKKYIRITSSDAGIDKPDDEDSLAAVDVVRASTEASKQEDRVLHYLSSLTSANTEADITSFKRIACVPSIALQKKLSAKAEKKTNVEKKANYVYYWIWTCCSCGGQTGMTTMVLNCPDPYCQHCRCNYCPLEQAKMREVR